MEAFENKHLRELGKSRFEVAPGQYDIRGWIVKNEDGRILGRVDDLVFDSETERVKYLVLDMDGNEMYLRDRKVMLPIDIAQLNEPSKNVMYPGTMANELTAIPTHEKGKFFSRNEELIREAFDGSRHTEPRGMTERARGASASDPAGHPFVTTEARSGSDEGPVGYASVGREPYSSPAEDRPKPQDEPLKYGATGRDVKRHAADVPDEEKSEEPRFTEQRQSDRIYTSPPQTGNNVGDEGRDIGDDEGRRSDEFSISHASLGYVMPETSRSSVERQKTVIGIFDHTNQAQAAAMYLEREGFPRENIDISLRDADDYDTSRQGEDRHSGIVDFFSSLFEDTDKARNYTDAARTCSVVTLACDSVEDAERAAEILDKHGAVNVDDRYEAHRHSDTDTFTLGEREKRKYHSLIVDRPDDGRVRGLR